MTTSGTTSFNPSIGELTIYSYNLIGVRGTALVQEHLEFARMATNMMFSSWSNRGVNLWKVDLVTVPIVEGTSTYNVDPDTVVMLDTYITTGDDPPIDRIMMPISRTEYANYPNKTMQGFPTQFWFDRLLSPTVTIWPVPDGSQTSLKYYRVTQIEDAAFTSGQTADIPYLWLEAMAFGLAGRLAIAWAPDRAQGLKMLADEAYNIAASQNVETSNFYISPLTAGYYR